MRIVHISDIHFGTEVPGLVDALADRIGTLAPDLVIASGDFTMAGRHVEFRGASAFLQRLSPPVIATPGNHDLPVYNLLERFAAPLARYRRWIAPETRDRLLTSEAAILSLNSARPWGLSLNWSHGRLSDRQIDEADAFFAQAEGSAFRALVVHHPFFVPEDLAGFRMIGNAEAMLGVLAARRVHAVFSGHLHTRSETSRALEIEAGRRTVHLLQVGTATSHRHRDGANGFSLVEAGADGVVVRPQIFDGDGFVDGGPPIVLDLD